MPTMATTMAPPTTANESMSLLTYAELVRVCELIRRNALENAEERAVEKAEGVQELQEQSCSLYSSSQRALIWQILSLRRRRWLHAYAHARRPRVAWQRKGRAQRKEEEGIARNSKEQQGEGGWHEWGTAIMDCTRGVRVYYVLHGRHRHRGTSEEQPRGCSGQQRAGRFSKWRGTILRHVALPGETDTVGSA